MQGGVGSAMLWKRRQRTAQIRTAGLIKDIDLYAKSNGMPLTNF